MRASVLQMRRMLCAVASLALVLDIPIVGYFSACWKDCSSFGDVALNQPVKWIVKHTTGTLRPTQINKYKHMCVSIYLSLSLSLSLSIYIYIYIHIGIHVLSILLSISLSLSLSLYIYLYIYIYIYTYMTIYGRHVQ